MKWFQLPKKFKWLKKTLSEPRIAGRPKMRPKVTLGPSGFFGLSQVVFWTKISWEKTQSNKQLGLFWLTCIWVRISIFRNILKSQCSSFSISAIPHGYWRARTRLSLICYSMDINVSLPVKIFDRKWIHTTKSIYIRHKTAFEPITANGILSFSFLFCLFSSSSAPSGNW